MNIIDSERSTYEAMWQHDEYGAKSPGEHYIDLFMDMTRAQAEDSVLDAGCGNGKGALALKSRGLEPTMCDITSVGLLPGVADIPFFQRCLWARWSMFPWKWVYCCDVLEHIPPTFTMLVVARLLELSREGVFLSIFLEPDQFGVMLGKPLHQSIQSFVQWRDQLSAVGTMVECRDLGNVGLYLVKP